MSNETYLAGIARADITPPTGIRLSGYTVREGFSRGLDEPLTATVLVLRARGVTVALNAHDWCVLSTPVCDDLARTMRTGSGSSAGPGDDQPEPFAFRTRAAGLHAI